MTETALAKPKRWTLYSKEDRAEVVKLFQQGLALRAISRQTNIPLRTVARWINKLDSTEARHRIRQTTVQVVQETEKTVKAIATKEVKELLDNSIRVGSLALSKAEIAIKHCNGRKHVGALVQATNAAKNGISIARQALGLDQDQSKPSQSITIGSMTMISRLSPEQALKQLTCVSEVPKTVPPADPPIPQDTKPL